MSDEAIRRVLMFDLSTKELEDIFGEGNTRKPYSDIRNFMEKNVFEQMFLNIGNFQAMCQ